MTKHQQILKSRDDNKPVILVKEDTPELFKLAEGCDSSWMKSNMPIGSSDLRPRIEPWLTALCQSEHLSLLLGSGLTNAVHYLAKDEAVRCLTPEAADFGQHTDLINDEAERSTQVTKRGKGNFEDKIRAANELLRGLEIMSGEKSECKTKYQSGAADLRMKLSEQITRFAERILEDERNIITAEPSKCVEAFNYLVSFLMSFASRTGTRDRLNIFTTNYDRLIEAGAELAGMHLLDRFVGNLAPIFRSSRLNLDLHYNPPGIRGEPRYLEGVARFTKLHGSLDWVDHRERSIRRLGVPFGTSSLKPYLEMAGTEADSGMHLMIYPNAAKDRETTEYPYVELFRDFASAICRPNHTLVVFGYSFGDDHINRVIEDMLTIPSTHLVAISRDDLGERIIKTYNRLGRHAQISLFIGNHVGDFKTLVDHYLPKPAIDRTTMKMAELLKSRWNTGKDDSTENN